MTDEFWNHGYVIIVLNRALDSSIRFCKRQYQSVYKTLIKAVAVNWHYLRFSHFLIIELLHGSLRSLLHFHKINTILSLLLVT